MEVQLREIPVKKDFRGRKEDWRAAQDEFYKEFRSETDPETLDMYGGLEEHLEAA